MHHRAVFSFLFVLVCACLLAPEPRADEAANWLDRLNFYRATASLPPVAEDRRLSGAIAEHARYMVMHDVVKHSQNRGHSWATPDGAAAAASSVLAGSASATEPDAWAVDVWMQAPFHALGMLDPALQKVGFGIHRAQNGKIQTAAGLDILRGRSVSPLPVTYPIMWPANATSVPLVTHTSEYPSPLTSCQGYRAPAGLPIIVQLGSGDVTPRVTDSWLVDGARQLEHCVFDESTYRNRNAAEQTLGRGILAARDAIVLIPRQPLRPGRTYRVVIDANGKRIDWSFGVSAR